MSERLAWDTDLSQLVREAATLFKDVLSAVGNEGELSPDLQSDIELWLREYEAWDDEASDTPEDI